MINSVVRYTTIGRDDGTLLHVEAEVIPLDDRAEIGKIYSVEVEDFDGVFLTPWPMDEARRAWLVGELIALFSGDLQRLHSELDQIIQSENADERLEWQRIEAEREEAS